MHVIDISPVYRIANDAILTLLGGVATFIAAWFTWLLHKYAPPFVGAALETKAADDLNTALANGVAVAMQSIEGAEKLHAQITVRNEIAAFAARYALNHAPDAMRAFALDLDALELKALAYLPVPPPSAFGTTGARAPAMPVLAQSLGKI
ncbi:MAG: hypothetical protein JO056_09340 [Alphaproteobacteria bacterium]|nr:hypothetical protein [Alphaproteobacteria bacterium]